MFLKKYRFLKNIDEAKKSFFNLHPFTPFKISRVKNDFLKKFIYYKEKEKKYMTLFGVDVDKENNKKGKTNKNNAKKFEKSFSSSSVLLNLNEILSLRSIGRKSTKNPINLNIQMLPQIQRRLKRYKTNLSINLNNINNIKLSNTSAKNLIKEENASSKNKMQKIIKSPFITDVKEIHSNNPISSFDKLELNKINNTLNLFDILNEKCENKSHNKIYKFNNHFSFNKMIPFNFNKDSHILINNKHPKEHLSNKSAKNIKSLSIMKNQLSRNKLNLFYNLSEKNLISNHINDLTKDKSKNKTDSLSSHPSQNSSEMKSSKDNKSKIHKNIVEKYSNKNLLRNMIKNKISDLQKEIDNNSKEQEKTNDMYKLYIKYMIHKSKFIYNIIDKHLINQIKNIDYKVKQTEIPQNILTIMEDNKNKTKKSRLQKMRNKIEKNEHLIHYLIAKNKQANQIANFKIDNILEKSNY